MDQALNSQKTPHTSPLRASYGMSFVSILMKNDRVIKGFYCTHGFHDNNDSNKSFRRHSESRCTIFNNNSEGHYSDSRVYNNEQGILTITI